MSEWISVNDRLPEPRGGDGIFRNDSQRVLCLVLSKVNGVKRMECGSYSHFYRSGWTEFEHDEYRGTSVVTHWMPLPSPPEDSQ